MPVSAGLIDFSFRSVGSSAVAVNGNNHGWSGSQFGTVLDPGLLSGRLLFENGRFRPDFDFDDMVIRFQVNVAPVPEADTVVMLLAGLALLFWFGQRARSRMQR